MDQRTRKLMTMHKALHPRDDIDRLYVLRKEGGRGLASLEVSVEATIQWLEDYIKKCWGRRITATRNNMDNTRINITKITKKEKWEEKQLYGYFKWQTSKISCEKTWTWLRKWNLQIAAQNNAIRTKCIKARVDKTQQNSKCWLCGDWDKTINDIICEYSKLVQKEFSTRHDWVGKVVHWELWKKLEFDHKNKCYVHKPESALENEMHRTL